MSSAPYQKRQSIFSADQIKDFKGMYIIASIDKNTGCMEIAPNPCVQPTQAEAIEEIRRLARLYPNKKYITLMIGASATVADVIVE